MDDGSGDVTGFGVAANLVSNACFSRNNVLVYARTDQAKAQGICAPAMIIQESQTCVCQTKIAPPMPTHATPSKARPAAGIGRTNVRPKPKSRPQRIRSRSSRYSE